MVEKDIVERIKAAKIRLRFDKVVLRLIARLQTSLTGVVRDEEAVIFTVTAPIRHPLKTAEALEGMMRDGRPNAERREVVYGNHVCIRWLAEAPRDVPKVLGFVHDRASDAGLIMALAETRLPEQDYDADA